MKMSLWLGWNESDVYMVLGRVGREGHELGHCLLWLSLPLSLSPSLVGEFAEPLLLAWLMGWFDQRFT